MPRTINDSAALDAFMRTYVYPAAEGLVVRDIPHHPVHARAHRGNAGAYFGFERLKALEAHVSELPPGAETKTHRHTCEALFYVLAGKGWSLVWDDDTPETKIEWQAGDLFFTPNFVWHKHVNADPAQPARYLEITTIPMMKSLGDWRIESVEEK